jgi:type IV secretory pathway VirB9-like protein
LIYDRDQIFLIQVAKGTATHIILGPDEKIVLSASGNAADCGREGTDWCVVANTGANEVFVQPRTTAPAHNNLELTTNLRRYSFDFVQAARTAAAPPPWYRVSFRYTGSRSESPVTSDAGAGKGRCNWNYSMSRSHGATGLAPLAVFDDGHDTYLMLPPGSGMPEVEGEAGAEQLRPAPGMASGQMLMLAGVRSRFTIRSSVASVAVWNDGFSVSAPGACPAW